VADRIVYLVDVLPKNAAEAKVELVTDATLTELTSAEGFEIASTLERAIQIGRKSVKATMVVLRPSAENRAVARVHVDDNPPPGREMVVVRDEWGQNRSVTPAQAMVENMTRALRNIGAPGHLGPAGDHNLPGMSIISGEMVSKAFDVGALAYARGQGAESNPFPPGSAPATKWLEGYRNAEKRLSAQTDVSQRALDDAYREGKAVAESLAPDDLTRPPYPRTDKRREVWLRGFQDGGGRVE
jgi:hypothetical protein